MPFFTTTTIEQARSLFLFLERWRWEIHKIIIALCGGFIGGLLIGYYGKYGGGSVGVASALYALVLFNYEKIHIKKALILGACFMLAGSYGVTRAGLELEYRNLLTARTGSVIVGNSLITIEKKGRYRNLTEYIVTIHDPIAIIPSLTIPSARALMVSSTTITEGEYRATLELGEVAEASREYYFSQKIFFTVTRITENALIRTTTPSVIAQLRARISDSVDFYTHFPQSVFIKSLLLNERDDFPQRLRDAFKKTNTYHIFAISGSHIAILILIFVHGLQLIGIRKKWALLITFGFIGFYLLLVALPIPAVRSALFSVISSLALVSSRILDMRKGALYVGVVFLLIDASLIRYDISFILSFVASVGLICLYPMVSHFAYEKVRIPQIKIITDPIFASIAVALAMLPLNFYYWGYFNATSFLANGVVVPATSIILLFGILWCGMFWLSPSALLLSFILEKLAVITIKFVEWFALHASMIISYRPSANFFFWYYSAIVLWYWWWCRYRSQSLIPYALAKKLKDPR